MKKSIITLLVLVTILMPYLESEAEGKQFTDINGHWAEQSIKDLNTYGMISGYKDGTFRPDNTVSRAEIIAWVTRILKFKMTEEEYQEFSTERDTTLYELKNPMSLQDYFKDYKGLNLPSTYWARTAIEEGLWLKVLPYDGLDRPKKLYLNQEDYNKPVTRGEVAYCLTRAAEWFEDEFPTPFHALESYASNSLKDIDNSREYPNQCEKAFFQGFFGGYSDKTFRPEKPITRAEATAVLLKLIEPQRAKPFTISEKPIELKSLYYSPNYENNNSTVTMKPNDPMDYYPPYYKAEDWVVHEVLDLARIMDRSASEMHNYEVGGYRRLTYNNNEGLLSLSFYESYKRFIFGAHNNIYLKDTDFGDFSIYTGRLRSGLVRDKEENKNGCIYELRLNPHWDMLKEYHWNAIEEICNYLFEDEADIILDKIMVHSNKTEYVWKIDYLTVNGRKVVYNEIDDGVLILEIEVK